MGVCDSCNTKIQQQACFPSNTKVLTKKEIDELYTYESALCKIKLQTIKDGKIYNGFGTGFFCEINDDNIPFKKALFTNNHVLNEINIENNKDIEFDYLKEPRKIKITKNRKKFTNKIYDYTCIEIFDSDKIQNYFKIDLKTLENKNNLKDKEIFILQYPNEELSHSLGIITDYSNSAIEFNVNTLIISSGSPLIKRYDNNLILGIHYGTKYKNDESIKVAYPLDIIIEDIKGKLNYKIQIINLIYDTENDKSFNGSLPDSVIIDSFNIFGKKFVENNKDNIELIIEGKKYKLMEKYDLKNGIINVQMIILNKLTNLECMFQNCKSLININDLQYLDTKEITDFSSMFAFCLSLTNIDALKNWDVSNGINFSYMFGQCSSLTNLSALQNWDVSNGKFFSGMFATLSSLTNLEGLENWDVSNGINFMDIFFCCEKLADISAIKNWNVSNGHNFMGMFSYCISLNNLNGLHNWNVSKSNSFDKMFMYCSSLSDITGLKNWNISNVKSLSLMFNGCKSLSDIEVLKNWDVSNVSKFDNMFNSCESLSNINALKNWNVSNAKSFNSMFKSCKSLSNINALHNWDVSNANNFSFMFEKCSNLSNLKPLRNWNISNGKKFYRMFDLSSTNLNDLEKWNILNKGFFEKLKTEDNSIDELNP